MSPRSREFLDRARDRLRAADAALAAGFPDVALSLAYYAALYAARAALSEEDRNAKTHRRVWSLFMQTFVATGRIEQEPASAVLRLQERREAVDYDAREISAEEAGKAVAAAQDFVGAVAATIDG